MNKLNSWTELFLASLQTSFEKIAAAIPYIIGAIVIFFLGWIFAKLVAFTVTKLLKLIKFDTLSERINTSEYLKKANISLSPSKLVGKFIYYIILLLVLITASETLGWDAVSTEISKLIGYMPNLFIAVVIFIIGVYIATFIRDIIAGATGSLGISSGKIISNFVFYLLLITISLTALSQAGVDTSIITSNMLLILGAILFSAAISYGFASKDVLSNVLAGFFSRNIFSKGMTIEVAGLKGTVEGITSTGLSLKDENGDINIIPTSILINNTVKVFKT